MRFTYSLRKMAKLFANSGDPDQTPCSAASDLGLHSLPINYPFTGLPTTMCSSHIETMKR